MTRTPQEQRYGDVLFSSDRWDEDERLAGLAASFDPVSKANLLAAGLSSGWRCLDVGAGTGTLSRWFAEVTGRPPVVVDRDTRFLRRLTDHDLEIVEADITDPALDLGLFDLIHVRFVLMHLRERDDVLRRLASWVAPGGALVISDAYTVGLDASPHVQYRTTAIAHQEMMARTIGSDHAVAASYPRALTGLGFQDVGADIHMPIVGIDLGYTRFLRMSLQQGRTEILAGGVAEETFEAALRHIDEPTTREWFFAMLTAWGRKP